MLVLALCGLERRTRSKPFFRVQEEGGFAANDDPSIVAGDGFVSPGRKT